MGDQVTLKSVPLYFQNFLASIDVKAMTTREIGAYILLLTNSIDQPNPGYLSTDETGLARIARLTEAEWDQDRKRVLKKFKHSSEGYHNSAMLKAIQEALEKRKLEESGDRLSTVNEKVDLNPHKNDTIHPLQTFVDTHFTYIKQIRSQLTFKQCEILINKRKFQEELIIEKLKLLENTAGCHNKWNSVFLTIEDWCLKETKKR